MRIVIEVIKQWCQEEAWYVRKGLQKIIMDTANLSPVLLPTRLKCNFTIKSILATVGCLGY